MTETSRKRAAGPPRETRVLDLANTSQAAKELLASRVAYLRDEHGIEGEILCSAGRYVDRMRAAGITVRVLNTPRSLKPLALLRSYVGLVRLLRRERYDIIHSHGSVLGLLTRLTKPFSKAVIVHTVHGFHFHENMPRPLHLLYEAAERSLAHLSDVVLSQNQEDFAVLESWRMPDRFEWIGNGIKLPVDGPPYRAERKDEYGLCCIARFEPVKNHRMIFEALAMIRRRGVRAKLTCFGAGRLLTEAQRHVRALGIADSVQFRGYVDDISPELAGMDLHLLSSLKEGMPRAIIETMAAGIPSVATDVKGTREVIADGITGCLVPLTDTAGFANAIADLLLDAERRQAMSAACVAHARAHYDESVVCDRLARLYHRLLEPRADEDRRLPKSA